jgi:hypothetical protein
MKFVATFIFLFGILIITSGQPTRRFNIPVAFPNTPFNQTDAINLGNHAVPYVNLIDTTNRFLYVSTSEAYQPSRLIKYDLTTFTQVLNRTTSGFNE